MTANPNANAVNPTAGTNQTTPTITTISSPSSSTSTSSTSSTSSAPQTAASSVGTMNQLQATNPQLYKAMMTGIAIQICNRSQTFQQQMQEYASDALADDNS